MGPLAGEKIKAKDIVEKNMSDLLRPGFERGISEVSGVTERSDFFTTFQNNTEVRVKNHHLIS